jgi:ABC-type uncharacterized transport system permease subunit
MKFWLGLVDVILLSAIFGIVVALFANALTPICFIVNAVDCVGPVY